MAYVNDAQTLNDVVGGASAAAQMGIQNDAANQEQQIKNYVAAGQAPAEIQKPGLANLLTQEQTKAEQGLAAEQQAKGLTALQTQPSASAATQAGNLANMTAEQAKKLGSLGQIAGQLAGTMQNVAPLDRPFKMQQILQANGIDPQSIGPLASGDPDTLNAFSQHAVAMSADYQTKQMQETMHNTGTQNVATTEAIAHTTAAEASANARRYASDNAVKIKQLSENIDQTIAALGRKLAAAGQNADPNDIALMHTLQQQQIITRQMGAANTAQLVGQGSIAQAPQFVPSGPGDQTGGTPATPPAAQGGSAVEAEMRRRGFLK